MSHDPPLAARILSRRPLRYTGGADLALDRPAHIRGGSSLAWIAERIVLVQDDVNFLAMVDPSTGEARAVSLPAGKGGARQFDDLRGNKRHRLDLEDPALRPRTDALGQKSAVSSIFGDIIFSKELRKKILCRPPFLLTG